MSGSRKSFSRRTFLKAAAGVTAGTGLMGQPLAAQSIARPAEAGTHSRFPRIEPQLMITPQQAWDWHVFKSQCGPTYAGSAGWKRFTDFLISKMPEFGAVDLDHVEIPYDHYIVDDWPDRRTHMHDSGIAVEKLVTDGTPRAGGGVLRHDVRLHAARGHHCRDGVLRSVPPSDRRRHRGE